MAAPRGRRRTIIGKAASEMRDERFPLDPKAKSDDEIARTGDEDNADAVLRLVEREDQGMGFPLRISIRLICPSRHLPVSLRVRTKGIQRKPLPSWGIALMS